MFKIPILTQVDNHKKRKTVATDKSIYILGKMGGKFPNPKLNILHKISLYKSR